MMHKIKAVIFDLDGTIGNTLPLCIRAFRQSIEPLIQKNISDEEIIATFGPSEEGTIMALAPEHYEKGLADYLHFYETFHDMCPAPFEGIKSLLSILKDHNVHISMVTGKGKYSTDISLKKFGLEDFFELIETGLPGGPRKTEGIKIILNSLSEIKKEEVIYVGDSPGDIIAGRNAGIPVVAAAWAETAEPHKLIELHPDELFYKVDDFTNWLKKRI